MKKEFALAFNELLDDKQLPKEVILEAIESAMVSAYRKTVNASLAQEVLAKIDDTTGDVIIFAEKEVVEEVMEPLTEVTLEVAKKEHPEAALGEVLIVESTPDNFGRVAAQTARQVVQQRIREAERQAQIEYFGKLTGEVVNGTVQAANPHMVTLALDRKAEGKMPRSQQIPGERFRVYDRVRALLLEVKDSPRGPEIILTRGHRDFLRRLLEDEVPEIYQGLVEIRSIAREPGYRSKVAVLAMQSGIDPVGACVGIRGVRIQAIVRELHDEKIDVIEWNSDPAQFIAKALSPARVSGVFLDERLDGNKTATVVVPEDQLSLAIGRDGQNARLAAKLTSWRIDIKSLPESASDSLFKLENDEAYAAEKVALSEHVPLMEGILAKKAEGRPITPEEYKLMTEFVNRVEMGAQARRQEVLDRELAVRAEVMDQIPPTAFDLELPQLELSEKLEESLLGDGVDTIGDLMLQLALDEEKILDIGGIGPKTIEGLRESLDGFEFPVVEEEPEEAIAEEAAAEEAQAELEEVPGAESELEEPMAEAPAEAVAEKSEPVDDIVKIKPEAKKKAKAKAEPKKAADDEASENEGLSVEEIFAQTEAKILGRQRRPAKAKTDSPVIVEDSTDTSKKSKKKKKARDLEYDPEHDVTIVRRRRDDEWGEGEW